MEPLEMLFYFNGIEYRAKLLITISGEYKQLDVFAIHPSGVPGSGLITFTIQHDKLVPYHPKPGQADFYEALVQSILAACKQKGISIFG